MVQVQQRVLIAVALLMGAPASARKFYPDDPLVRDPKPLPVEKVRKHGINEYFDFFQNTFWEPDKEEKKRHDPVPSEAVNTLGEVPDSAWFTNFQSPVELVQAAFCFVDGNNNGNMRQSEPLSNPSWFPVRESVSPSKGRKYFLKFDPMSNPEMASAADVIGSKFFYGLGYNTPENYVVNFGRRQLTVSEKSTYSDPRGHERPMTDADVDDIMRKVPKDREGGYRGMASLAVPGDAIGPFRYYGTRTDDPNDIVSHENRRDLRGLYVFAAWLNHTDSKSINSMDTMVDDGGVSHVKHFLIDFGAILGSDSFEPKSPRAGNVYLFDFKPAAWQFLSLGLYAPTWMRADYPHIREVGHLEYETFDPERWRNNYPNPAFDLRTPGDTFWAAKKVMAFSDDAIRAVVATGRYSDRRASEWVSKCLIERRNRIGRTFFNDVLPLDGFSVRDGRLYFEDLAAKYGFQAARRYEVAWSEFNNETEMKTPLRGAASFAVPSSAAEYLAADIRGDEPRKTVTVYLRGNRVVGIDRTW
ncbi:MAG: hypothetical protein LAQ30_27380 [Acidobacteriia bacterium]|nr:hypothetical protein [Terriglobia bacterium]